MRIRLKFEREDIYWIIATSVLAIVLFTQVSFSWGALVVFLLAYAGIKWLVIEWKESLAWLWTTLGVIFSSVFSIYMVQYLLLDEELRAKIKDDKLWLNIVCAAVLYTTIQSFTNNFAVTCMISHTMLMLLATINYFVFMFRGNEFIFSDIRSAATGLSVAGNYTFTIDDRAVYVILWSTLFFSFIRKCNISFVDKKIWMRVVCISMVILGSVYVASETARTVTETWEQKGSYKNGYILNFVLSVRDYFVQPPNGYSSEIIATLEADYTQYAGEMPEEKPTVIVIMSESYSDLSVVGDFVTNQEVTPYYDSLTENTIKGYALSSVFGAKTANSEWEFMSGNSMAFLPDGAVVYQQYIAEEPTSLVSHMKNFGYNCVALHPYYETGWSRNLVYPDIGFDEMYFLEHFDENEMVRRYISDEEYYNKIIERFESKSGNEDLFIMSISMQNHGGYTEKYDSFLENIRVMGGIYEDANQYLSLLNKSDKALEDFITYFENVEEPVEIVFFGDHLPSLKSKFFKSLNGKGLSGLDLQELQDLYTIPFMIWTNYDTEEVEIEISSINYLSTLALERAGLPMPAYNQFLMDLMEQIPAINSRGYYSISEGKYKYLDEAEGEEAEWINKYEMLQYNNMFDLKEQSELFFPYFAR
ncbi:MAG: LTA synthase family protein [Roseburia sp.]|nr:LTA synthase family protein [Roseburia sp.]